MGVYSPPYYRTRVKPLVTETCTVDNTVTNFVGTCTNPTAYNTIPYITQGHVSQSVSESMVDIVTPSFEKLKGSGKIVNNYMLQTKVVTRNPPGPYTGNRSYYVNTNCSGVWKSLWKGPTQIGQLLPIGPYASWAPTPLIDEERLINLAVTDAWAKADLSKAAALASLGEAKETIHGIIGVFSRFIRLLIAFKKLDAKALRKQLSPKELSDMYMEFRYGIRPLYFDALQIIDAVKHSKYGYDRWTFRAQKSEVKVNTLSGTCVWNSEMKNHYSSYTTVDVLVRAGVMCQVSEPSVAALWGLTNVVESAWELVPFSFIVDWFFNVGKTIAAWTPNASLKPLASWYTVEKTVYQYAAITGTTFTPISGRLYLDPTFDFTGHKSVMTVTKLRQPNPKRTAFPSFDLKLDCLKLLDLVIIARKIWQK